MKSSYLLLFLSFISFQLYSQLNNNAFIVIDSIAENKVGEINLKIGALGFTKNNEYFNGIADGYTLFGSQLYPELEYTLNSQFKVNAGVFIRDDWGNPGVEQIIPTLTMRAKYQGLEIILGALDGAVAHQLIEPLYDFERVLLNRIEQGVQFKIKTPNGFVGDLWVEWETMLYKGEPKQEEVYGGWSSSIPIKNHWKIPIQFLVYHQGGSFDSSPDPLKTITNLAVGVVRNDRMSGKLKSLENSFYYLNFKDFSNVSQLTYNRGDGFYFNSSLNFHNGMQLMLSYWEGHEFISLIGGALYPSVSSTYKRPDFTRPLRQLLIFRLLHDIPLGNGVILTTRFEPLYDFQRQKFEFSHGLYIQFGEEFHLWKKRRD